MVTGYRAQLLRRKYGWVGVWSAGWLDRLLGLAGGWFGGWLGWWCAVVVIGFGMFWVGGCLFHGWLVHFGSLVEWVGGLGDWVVRGGCAVTV